MSAKNEELIDESLHFFACFRQNRERIHYNISATKTSPDCKVLFGISQCNRSEGR